MNMTADVVQRRVTMQYLINPDVTLCQRERIEFSKTIASEDLFEAHVAWNCGGDVT